tara:strand:+ start:4522 stop:4848 length:327 start_codon:yes stop_codon:yes gene_type:complete
MLRPFVIAAALLFAPATNAQQSAIRYPFLEQVAPLTPALYCAADVATLRAGDDYSIEHVFPAPGYSRRWAAKAMLVMPKGLRHLGKRSPEPDACGPVHELGTWRSAVR